MFGRGEEQESQYGNTTFGMLGREVGELVAKKNEAYGDSFAQCGEFLQLLYPQGVKPEEYGDMLAIVRVWDKLKRIATDQDAFGESPWKDVAGYALLALERRTRVIHEDCEPGTITSTQGGTG
jgi:hypothetical protein